MISLFILLPLYFIGIQYERGGVWKLLLPITFIALVLDVILNYTEWVLIFQEFPHKTDWTVSKRLKRMNNNQNAGWKREFSLYVSKVLDVIAPFGKHI